MTKGGAVNTALKLYPPWWRDRYLEEAQAVTGDLIEAGGSRWRISLNLSGGALRARLTAKGMPMEAEPWASRTRASIVLATAPTLAVVPVMLTIRQVPALPRRRWRDHGIEPSGHDAVPGPPVGLRRSCFHDHLGIHVTLERRDHPQRERSRSTSAGKNAGLPGEFSRWASRLRPS